MEERERVPMNLDNFIAFATLVINFIGLILKIIEILRNENDRS